MAKNEEVKFLKINKNKIDQYPLSGKVRNFALKNDASYILINQNNKVVIYYTLKVEDRVFHITHFLIEEKYEKYLSNFEEKICKDMKYKILGGIAHRAELKECTIQARKTFIPHVNLITLIFSLMIIMMLLIKPISLGFLLGISIAYLFGIEIKKK